MSIFKNEPDYFDIGKNAPADKFLQEYQAQKKNSFDTGKKNTALIEGALQAFRDGRPGNIQTALLNIPNKIPSILLELSKNSSDKLAVVNLALAKIPEEERKEALNNALYSSIRHGTGGEAFFALLLDSGAEGNAKIGGYAGTLLITAVANKSPLSVVKLLCDRGASFDDALTTMQIRGYRKESIKNLEFFHNKITGRTAPAEAGPAATEAALPAMIGVMQHLLEQVDELTKRVGDLAEEVRSLKSPAPASPDNPLEKKPSRTGSPLILPVQRRRM